MVPDPKVFVIAEAGVNHNGSLDMAHRLVDIAADARADAVKFQTFRAAALAVAAAPKADYQISRTDRAQSHQDMLRNLQLSVDDHRELMAHCRERGLSFLSTPFDEASVDLLADELGLGLLKLPSGEVTNGPLLLKAAEKRLPLILSTGMCTLAEVRSALSVLAFGLIVGGERDRPEREAFERAFASPEGAAALAANITLLHCTTEYPAPLSSVNLRAMDTLAATFGLPVGYSDHTEGILVPVMAVARGATVVEKHFTLDRTLPGPDHAASLEPTELAEMVTAIRAAEDALGNGEKVPQEAEAKNMAIARRSLVGLRAIAKGEVFTPENLGARRPGGGLSPMAYWELLGTKAKRDFAAEEMIER